MVERLIQHEAQPSAVWVTRGVARNFSRGFPHMRKFLTTPTFHRRSAQVSAAAAQCAYGTIVRLRAKPFSTAFICWKDIIMYSLVIMR